LFSRWYRPPEVIMVCPFYDTKVDIWGLGCIIYELAYMFDNVENDPEERFLFKGTSCYPLSPMKDEQNEITNIGSNDQLVKILQVLGP